MLALADDLVSGGERDHLFQLAAENDGAAVRNEAGDGVGHGEVFRHGAI
jgi:hypothetical protein